MKKSFQPINYQTPLNSSRFILKNPIIDEDQCVPMDVLFLGGGSAGLCGAIRLALNVKKAKEKDPQFPDVEIGVLEKAQSLGGHSLSGAVINPVALKELFPELSLNDFPFKNKVKSEKVYFLTSKGKVRLPTPPTMKNHGYYSASLCEVIRWLGEKAESLGVHVFTSFPAQSLLVKEDQVIGVRTAEAGLNKDGSQGEQHMPPTDITASVTVLCEGTRGPITQSYLEKTKTLPKSPQIYALGVKEVWRVKKPLKDIIHTLGWPLPSDTFGGSWIYPMGEDMISLGLVAGLDYKSSNLDVHAKLQNLKNHPLVQPLIEGGELVEWGAKTIPEGGFHSFPQKLSGHGVMICGDAAGMVNVPALKGIHYAMKSGILAADTLINALKNNDFSPSSLESYDKAFKTSYIYKDLKKVRNIRQAFIKSNFWIASIKAAFMTLTHCVFPPQKPHQHEDAQTFKTLEFTPLLLSSPRKFNSPYKLPKFIS